MSLFICMFSRQFASNTYHFRKYLHKMAKSQIPNVKFNNGYEIPMFGLGTWKSNPGEVTQAVKDAIDIGYRHLDCAFIYGNEEEVGIAIKDRIDAGVVKREDLFITSKLWNSFHRADLVIGACRKSLQNLRLEYLDLYLIHWPIAYKEDGELKETDAEGNILLSDADYVDTWREFEKCVQLGMVKNIGLSNFNSQQIKRVLNMASIKPVAIQVECNPYLNQRKLIEFCHSKGLVVTGYSPLGSRDSPFLQEDFPKLLEDSRLQTLSRKYGKSVAQIALRYQIQRGVVMIPKSVNKTRLKENIDIFDFELSAVDVAFLDTLNFNGRVCTLGHAINHKHYPFNIEY